MDGVNEKAANSYRILDLGSTTGSLEKIVTAWIDGYEGVRPQGE